MSSLSFRRWVGLSVIGALLLAVPVTEASAATSSQTVTVPATQAWTDTGISLPAGTVSFTASGTINVFGGDPGYDETPAGDGPAEPQCIAGPNTDGGGWTADGFPCWSLIGRIGNGAAFEIGDSATYTVSSPGELYLGVDDQADAFGDNSGSWTVQASWTPSGVPAAPTNLTATAVAPSAIRLTWTDNSSNESGFEINNGVTSQTVGANATSYTWGSLKPNTYMCFHIRAYNSAGDSSWDPNVSPYYVCTTTPNVVSVPNLNWGGYTTGFVNPDPQNYPLAVSATWKVPAVSNCLSVLVPGNYGDVTTWVGLGGVGSNDLEQIGTEVACHDGPLLGPYYYAVYDLYPTDSSLTQLSTTQYPVSPGDSMRADVVEQGAGTGGSQFVLQEWDTGSSTHPKNWYFETTWLGPGTSDPNVTPLTADWIVEDPLQPPQGTAQETFMQFSPAEVFKGCYWTQDNVKHYLGQGSSLTKDTITANGTSTGTPKELTGAIATNGTQFQITWKHN